MTSGKRATPLSSVLTASDVRSILGDVDDALIVDILGTGANSEQVVEAFARISGNTSLGEDLEKPADTIVQRIMEILSRDQEAEEER